MLICGNCFNIIDTANLASSISGRFTCPHCNAPRQLPDSDYTDNNTIHIAHAPVDEQQVDDEQILPDDQFNGDDNDQFVEEEDNRQFDNNQDGEEVDEDVDAPQGNRNLKRKRILDESSEDDETISDDENQAPPDQGNKKRKVQENDDEGDVPLSLGIGKKVNTLRLERKTFRFAFWNLENLTSDIIYQGKRQFQSNINSEKNIVRISFCAGVVMALDLDCLAVMELGSDGETVLKMLVAAISKLDSEHEWNFTMSTLTGSVISPPDELSLTLKPFSNPKDTIRLLSTILPYYTVMDANNRQRYVERYIRAHQLLARRSDHGQYDELEELFEELFEQSDDLSHEYVARQICLTLEEVALQEEYDDHLILARLFCADNSSWQQLVVEFSNKGHFDLLAIFFVMEGLTLELSKNQRAILTDGPLHALRCLGYNVGRYERYGVIFRTGLYESYLLNDLIMTDLLKEGLPTNRRAAISFNMPLGMGRHVGAYMIHSMYTPLLGPKEKMSSKEGRMLRVKTLVAQGQYACSLQPWQRPLFIFGDTNVDRKDIDIANEEMEKCGYRRIGGTQSTTLRKENTLRSAFTRTGDFYCQPFDAVYQLISGINEYPTVVSYPSLETAALQDLFLQLLSRNKEVREWYFIMLKRRYQTIYSFCNVRRKNQELTDEQVLIQGAISSCAIECNLTRDAPANIYPTSQTGQKFLSMLFMAFGNAMKELKWAQEGGVGIDDSDDEGSDEEVDDDKDDPREKKASLEEHVRAYCSMAPETERAYLLFHRHFISDHRIVMMLMQYGNLVFGPRIERQSPPLHWPTLQYAVTTAGFSRQGSASGRGSSCFLYSLLQLVNDDEDETNLHTVVRIQRRELALGRVIPSRGFLDPADQGLQSWVSNEYAAYTIQIWARNTITGALEIRYTIGTGGTTVNMLLDGYHYTPLWL